jgi:hypothetical protein
VGTKRVSRIETGRFDVRSADGTSIAVWVEGEGPALVMVHGSIADHTTFEPLIAVGVLGDTKVMQHTAEEYQLVVIVDIGSQPLDGGELATV